MFPFALRIIFKILNKSTQYISFLAIALFLTLFLLIKESLVIYEEKFINSLKGLYPEYVTNSTSTIEKLKNENIEIVQEVFVYSEEILFSYNEDDEMAKFMNVRTFDKEQKDILFSTIDVESGCVNKPTTIWLSERLYLNMKQDAIFNGKYLYFIDSDDEYIKYDICTFKLANDEKWLVTSTSNAKNIAYLPLPTNSLYTTDKNLKEELLEISKINNWKKYIDYEDLGIFLLAQHISQGFLVAFFIFLSIFMMITFSSLTKEFELSIFLQKLYGMNFFKTIILFSIFFFLYIVILLFVVFLFYTISTVVTENILNITISLDLYNIFIMFVLLMFVGVSSSFLVVKKYHKLPL